MIGKDSQTIWNIHKKETQQTKMYVFYINEKCNKHNNECNIHQNECNIHQNECNIHQNVCNIHQQEFKSNKVQNSNMIN